MANTGTTAYPAALDDYTNVGTTTYEDDSGYAHTDLHNQVHEAIEAIEETLGTTAATGVIGGWAAGALAAKKNNDTLGSPTINAPTIGGVGTISGTVKSGRIDNTTFGTPALVAPTISGAGTFSGTTTGGVFTNATISSHVAYADSRFKVGYGTKDISATAAVAITGIGFQPKGIILMANIDGTKGASWGFYDATSNRSIEDYSPATEDAYYAQSGAIFIHCGASDSAYANVTATGADGFTLTWGVNGTPTGVAAYTYICFR